ncbi:MAG: glycogen/starch/alpha-glucan phosphorylase, partial [Firmicutes bacterium]|nr:glycogen/starch/alpha-glucan phosphorylase [Bacillota bacterium]
NLINLGIYDEISAELETVGKTVSMLEEIEAEPSLGNGGLGRLAACFLDSIATLGLPGDGIGLNYHLGLFQQKFADHLQAETINPWITENSWLKETDISYTVNYKDFSVQSKLYDIDVTGYQNRSNQLHLFDIKTIDESIVKEGIKFDKKDILHNLTLFLYPDDSDKDGQLLRIFQQYFMVSNAAQLILDEAIAKGSSLHDLEEYVVIQINDTHPTLVIPELIYQLRLRNIDRSEAIEIVSKICAYTNHTILAEALEKWPLDYLEHVVPHLIPVIKELDEIVRTKYEDRNCYIIDENNRVHMAHIDIHFSFSVNGVAALHTDILKNNELNTFYKLYPNKFNNKTNGITFRRWLMHCNRPLTDWITSLIGDGFKKDANELKKLLEYKNDEAALKDLLEIKLKNKLQLKDHILKKKQIEIDENSIFDIQIKRLHEYKRQQMNALYLIYKYLEIKKGNYPSTPITAIFGAKAASSYVIAKDIIHLLLCLEELINKDSEVAKYLKVVMIENYNVTEAEKLIPACDISEQISLASKEASGTGNMKFMLNGAVTLGTMDGANIEIAELVGESNIYIFGASSDEVIQLYRNATYSSEGIYQKSQMIQTIVDFIVGSQLMEIGHKENLQRLYNELRNKDWFMTLLDLENYIQVKEKALKDYEDRISWAEKTLINISNAGYFSSDRTISFYNKDIWKLS